VPVRRPAADRFKGIRAWEGRQDRAFEELCFQLRDPLPPGAELIKTRAPDAGLEWYWRHADGTESGWQAKFIFETDDLLDGMRESLDTVRDKRPHVRILIFCLPIDLADDPSEARGKQARQRFDEAVVRWKDRAPNITIKLLTGGELLERLAREEHRGREWFFFNERVLGSDWCAKELKATIEDAGDRYTPQQNVDLPIDRILEAVAMPDGFISDLRARRDRVLLGAREVLTDTPERAWSGALAAVRASFEALEATPLVVSGAPHVATHPSLLAIEACGEALDALDEVLRPIAWAERPSRTPRSAGVSGERDKAQEAAESAKERERMAAQGLWSRCSKLQSQLHGLRSFLRGPACQAAERRTLFVNGPAGSGKTHLCCDVGERLLAEGHPVVVTLGERFQDQSPWQTLARLLGEPALSPDEIATCLAASGEAADHRAVVYIDALNESRDPTMWSTELADVRRRLTETRWVGLAVTCRTTYLDLVEPRGGRDEAFARVEHPGYRGREFEATEQIFAAHGVEQPRVPLLIPEFSNPLFLKLYCQGLGAGGSAPTGGEHLSEVFRSFIGQRAGRVEKRLGLDPKLDIVKQAMDLLAEHLASTGADALPYREAHKLINALAPHQTESPRTLVEVMASEGLLAIDRRYLRGTGERTAVVGFPYQRFSDHLLLSAFLAQRLPPDAGPEAVVGAFAADQALGEWLDQASGGLVEALAVQLPERWGVELPDVLADPEPEDWERIHALDVAWDAFAASLVVRDRRAFTDRTSELINEGLQSRPTEIADALISVAPDPDHPFNALPLHDFLASFPMAERDAWWTKLHYHAFGDPSTALDRLIRWAARGPYPAYPAEVIELAAIPLVWVLASPNRFARDYTTKALASLLMSRLPVATKLVERVSAIDDPYVKQRLAASCVGAVTRGSQAGFDRAEVDELLSGLVAMIESEQTMPDVLLRDHVATLARWLRQRKLIGPSLLKRAVSPYSSKPPKMPRSERYLEQTYPRADERETGYGSLLYSAMSLDSDWSRYVVSRRADDFLPVRLGDPVPEPEPAPSTESLFRVDRRAWSRVVRTLTEDQQAMLSEDEPNWENFFASFDAEQHELVDKAFVPRRPRRRRANRKPVAFPPERSARYIFQRCIELGWTPERFGSFDSSIGRADRGRDASKPERFGKKYQWIALYELLARLADNFIYNDWGRILVYDGAWQQGLRNMDPTLPPERIVVGDNQEHEHDPTFPSEMRPTWWTTGAPRFEDLTPGQESAWAARRDDLPTTEEVLRIVDPEGHHWLVIEGYRNWRDDPTETATVYEVTEPDRDLAILIRSTLIRRSDLGTLREWLATHPDLLRALPDWQSQGIYEGYLAELPEAQGKFDHAGGWRRKRGWGTLPVSSAAATLGYTSGGSSYDCSLTETASIEMPAKMLYELAGIAWDENRNGWVDAQGRLVAQHRETDEGFHRDRVLMFSEAALAEVLRSRELVLAVGLFSERRVFDRKETSIPEVLGWVDYVGHMLFDGENWAGSDFLPIDRRR
jgi:hypothetical protein